MKTASAFAPGHLTGFFQICDSPANPIYRGARGAGVSIVHGIHTKVIVEPADKTSWLISINDETTREAPVSENVLSKMLGNLDEYYKVFVEHKLEVPLGAGFGSSGGGALTLAISLNQALELNLTTIEAAQIAHIAEIECKTGLGSVFAAFLGGFGVLFKPGSPGIGEAIKYGKSEELVTVYLPFGPIPTKKALENEALRNKINQLGGKLVDELKKELTPSKFMKLSRRFTEHLDMLTPRIKRVFKEADKEKVPCTMAMFGEVVFSIIHKEELDRVVEVYKNSASGYNVFTSAVDNHGARITNMR